MAARPEAKEAVIGGQNTCPKDLWNAFRAWGEGRLSTDALVDAGYYAMLDILEDYRWLPLPTPPHEVMEHRALSKAERRAVSEEALKALHERFGRFYAQEAQVVQRNKNNLQALLELRAWAPKHGIQDAILQQIDAKIAEHRDPATADSAPVTFT